jgi:carbon monoxide dehydrogenase subunit G
MQINSDKALVQATSTDIIKFLSDSENLIHLLPQDKITDWEANQEKCSFKVQGGIVITLVQNGIEGSDKLFLKSGDKSPFPFDLTIHLDPKDTSTEGYIEFNGNVNMFLKMMVEKPLTALFNHMTKELQNWYADKHV